MSVKPSILRSRSVGTSEVSRSRRPCPGWRRVGRCCPASPTPPGPFWVGSLACMPIAFRPFLDQLGASAGVDRASTLVPGRRLPAPGPRWPGSRPAGGSAADRGRICSTSSVPVLGVGSRRRRSDGDGHRELLPLDAGLGRDRPGSSPVHDLFLTASMAKSCGARLVTIA